MNIRKNFDRSLLVLSALIVLQTIIFNVIFSLSASAEEVNVSVLSPVYRNEVSHTDSEGNTISAISYMEFDTFTPWSPELRLNYFQVKATDKDGNDITRDVKMYDSHRLYNFNEDSYLYQGGAGYIYMYVNNREDALETVYMINGPTFVTAPILMIQVGEPITIETLGIHSIGEDCKNISNLIQLEVLIDIENIKPGMYPDAIRYQVIDPITLRRAMDTRTLFVLPNE